MVFELFSCADKANRWLVGEVSYRETLESGPHCELVIGFRLVWYVVCKKDPIPREPGYFVATR